MLKAEECRGWAAQCLKLAGRTADSRDKALLVAMTERWLALADRIEERNAEVAFQLRHMARSIDTAPLH